MNYKGKLFFLILVIYSLNCFSINLEKILEKEEIKVEFDKQKISNQDFSKIINETENIINNVFGRDSNNIIKQLKAINITKGSRFYSKENYFLKIEKENLQNNNLTITFKKIDEKFNVIYLENSTKYPNLSSKTIENGTLKDASKFFLKRFYKIFF